VTNRQRYLLFGNFILGRKKVKQIWVPLLDMIVMFEERPNWKHSWEAQSHKEEKVQITDSSTPRWPVPSNSTFVLPHPAQSKENAEKKQSFDWSNSNTVFLVEKLQPQR
jgi:hypothetical protein